MPTKAIPAVTVTDKQMFVPGHAYCSISAGDRQILKEVTQYAV